jgi:Ca2+-binding EF-hand superfamily protein
MVRPHAVGAPAARGISSLHISFLKGLTMTSISGMGQASAWASMRPSGDMKAKMFAKADSDSSGGVSQTELQSMFDDIASKTGNSALSASDNFSKLDANGDGSLDSSEMDKGMKDLMPKPSSTTAFAQSRASFQGGTEGMGGMDAPPPPPPPSDEASNSDTNSASSGTSATSSSSKQYDELDTNKDGEVSEQERLAGAAKDSIQALLKAVDSDGDQNISDTEMATFQQMLSKAVDDGSGASGAPSAGGTHESNSADSGGGGHHRRDLSALTQLTQRVLQEYAKAASAANQGSSSSGSTLDVAA